MTAMNEVNTVNERNMDMEGKSVKEKRTYTVKEIQEILDVSKPTVYALLKRKEFHSIIIGGKHRRLKTFQTGASCGILFWGQRINR